jgi:hypothetical protein
MNNIYPKSARTLTLCGDHSNYTSGYNTASHGKKCFKFRATPFLQKFLGIKCFLQNDNFSAVGHQEMAIMVQNGATLSMNLIHPLKVFIIYLQ